MPVDSLIGRVADDLRRRIGNREFPIGARLPSRRALAEHYQVALLTAHRAVGQLVAEGVLQAADRRTPQVARMPASRQRALPVSVAGGGRIALVALTHARATDLAALHHERAERILLPIELGAANGQARSRLFNLNRLRPDGQHERRPLAEVLAEAVAWGADRAAVVDPYADPELRDQLQALVEPPLRLVYAGAGATPLAIPVPQALISSDDAGWTAASHLLAAGYEEIIAWQPFTAPWFPERIARARAACSAAGRPGALRLVDHGGPIGWRREIQIDEARRRLPELLAPDGPLRRGQARRAVLAPNDVCALLVLEALAAAGIAAGGGVGVIGCDDEPGALAAGLTSLRPPLDALGAAAGRLLAQGEVETVLLPHQLIARGSTDPTQQERA